jgi:hypothetical protein
VFTEKVLLSGGISAILPNLITMATPPEHKFTYDIMLKAVIARSKHIDLPTIKQPCADDVDRVKINIFAYPGFFSSLFYGKSRFDTNEVTSIVAKHLFKRVTTALVHAQEIWRFGCRPKVVDLSVTDKILRTRPIAMCDDVLSKLCSIVSQPLMEALIRSPHSEIFVGRSLGYDETKFIEQYIYSPLHLCGSPD